MMSSWPGLLWQCQTSITTLEELNVRSLRRGPNMALLQTLIPLLRGTADIKSMEPVLRDTVGNNVIGGDDKIVDLGGDNGILSNPLKALVLMNCYLNGEHLAMNLSRCRNLETSVYRTGHVYCGGCAID